MISLRPTLHFRRRHLPHWEVLDGRYFITVRCADSLPRDAVERLRELNFHLASIPAASPQFAAQQRQVFRTLEKYLDARAGACPLRQPAAIKCLSEEFAALAQWDVSVPHYTIMPNHWHALLVPGKSCTHSLSKIMKRLKGRTGKSLRAALGGSGPIWQGEWFDRWVRDESEWTRIVDYIHANPVKAGLARSWSEHPGTR